MKKRLLASLMSLCLIVGLLPTAAFAAEADTTEEVPQAVVCEATPGCTLEAGHEGDCVVAPAEGDSSEMGNDPAAQPGGGANNLTDDIGSSVNAAEQHKGNGSGIGEENAWNVSANDGKSNVYAYLIEADDGKYDLHFIGTGAIKDFAAATEDTAWRNNTLWGAEEYYENIAKVIFEDGITRIGNSTLESISVESVYLPDSLTSIGKLAFLHTYSADKMGSEYALVLPENCTELGESAFARCDAIQSITLPEGLKTISKGIFAHNENLKSVTIPSTIETIEYGALMCCSALESVVLNEGIKSIGQYAFQKCTSLKIINFPSTIETIAQYAFQDCSALEEVDLSEVRSLGDNSSWAFSNCSGLKTFKINTNLNSSTVLNGTDNIETVEIGPDVSSLPKGLFAKKEHIKTVFYDAKSLSAEQLFLGCTGLETITLGDEVSLLPKSFLQNCTNLKEIELPDSIQTIQDYAFHSSGLEYIKFGSGLATVGSGILQKANSLKVIDLTKTNYTFDTTSHNYFLFPGSNKTIVYCSSTEQAGALRTCVNWNVGADNSKISYAVVSDGTVIPDMTLATLGTAAKDNAEFTGWYKQEDDTPCTTPEDNVIYVAGWDSDDSSKYSVPDKLDFGSAEYGVAIDSKTIKVTPVSTPLNEESIIKSAVSSDSDVFSVSEVEGDSVTVSPKQGLPAGEYNETIYVITENDYCYFVNVELSITKTDSQVTPDEDTGNIEATYGDTIIFVAEVKRAQANGIQVLASDDVEQDQVIFKYGDIVLGTAHVDYTDDAYTQGIATLFYSTKEGDIPVTENGVKITAVYGGSINLNGSNMDSIQVTLSKAQPVVGISADTNSLSGGGTVTLTVDKSRLPHGEEVSVTCDNISYTPIENEDGIYTVSLPNSTATYVFTVSYDGNEWYNAASSTCTVSVSRTGGSSGGGSSSTRYTISTPSDVDNGSIKVNPSRASKGSTVTITVKPDEGYVLDELVVTDKNGDTVKLTDKGDGKYTFKMPASKVEIEVSFILAADPDVNQPFVDVSPDAYYADAVAWAVENGITNGTSDTTFGPDVSCTRAQMVTFLWRQAGAPKATGSNPFTDVQAGSYYYDAVLWAVEQGITSGTSATTFAPDATVTRAQTVTFLWRQAGAPVVNYAMSFTDVDANAYYGEAVRWAVSEGITSGTSATTFSPDTDCSRAQIVTFMYRDMAE